MCLYVCGMVMKELLGRMVWTIWCTVGALILANIACHISTATVVSDTSSMLQNDLGDRVRLRIMCVPTL